MGAALRRDRGAKRPQDFSSAAKITGAALRPYRDARPLPQRSAPVAGDWPVSRTGWPRRQTRHRASAPACSVTSAD
ncbi:hypothetical protein CW309_23360 [Pseudomonas hunanensis]|nr:hypothetical protein CW309_23360 [Pseudomonas hunanensis]